MPGDSKRAPRDCRVGRRLAGIALVPPSGPKNERRVGSRLPCCHDHSMTISKNLFQTLAGLAQRDLQPELMDQPNLDPVEHALALRGLARVNWFSRSDAIFWPVLRAFSLEQKGTPLRVLDVACGGGDVTCALAKRARRAGLDVKIAGCDLSETALSIARKQAASSGEAIEFFQHDVLSEQLPARFDVVICSLFLHHLDEVEAVTVLRSMSQGSRRAVLVNDLVRSRCGYLLAMVGTRLLSRSRIVHIDGPLSVAGAFTPPEALQLCEQAELNGATFSRHWPQRFLMKWSRP